MRWKDIALEFFMIAIMLLFYCVLFYGALQTALSENDELQTRVGGLRDSSEGCDIERRQYLAELQTARQLDNLCRTGMEKPPN